MTRTTGRRGAAVIAVAAALGLGACGSQGEVTEPGDGGTVTAPSDGEGDGNSGADEGSTGAGEAVDAEPGEEVAVQDLLERLKSPGEDQLGSFELTMDLAGAGEEVAVSGQAELTGESPEMDLQMTVPEMGELHMILADGSVYLAIPGLVPEGDFFEVPASELEGFGMEDLTESIDIESTWEGWDQGAQTVTYVGPEDIEGQQLDHYAVVVDTSAAAEAMGESDTAGMPPELTYDVWVDEQDLMRQVSFEMDGGKVDMAIDKWGEDFDIQAPPPANITKMPSLGEQG